MFSSLRLTINPTDTSYSHARNHKQVSLLAGYCLGSPGARNEWQEPPYPQQTWRCKMYQMFECMPSTAFHGFSLGEAVAPKVSTYYCTKVMPRLTVSLIIWTESWQVGHILITRAGSMKQHTCWMTLKNWTNTLSELQLLKTNTLNCWKECWMQPKLIFFFWNRWK